MGAIISPSHWVPQYVIALDSNEGAFGDVLLRVIVECTEDELREHEWVEGGKPYREFLVPDDWLNGRCRAIEDVDEDAE